MKTSSALPFAARLACCRAKAGLTQRQLAVVVGLSQVHIARLETGVHEPRLPTVRRLAAALGVSLTQLLE